MRKKYLCILICLFANALAFASAANRQTDLMRFFRSPL